MEMDMDNEDYFNLHSQQMHGMGTTPTETFLAIFPSIFAVFITTTLLTIVSAFKTLSPTKTFIIEFITLLVPLILNFTILSSYVNMVNWFLFCTSLAIAHFVSKQEYFKLRGPSLDHLHNSFVTNSRSTINVLSVAAILAVDFKIFPRRFAKTTNFGYSLMDVGVGLYIFSNGIIAPAVLQKNKKEFIKKSFKSTLPLLIIGIGRYILTKQLNYQVPVTEYGLHWNFFITLALIKLFASILLNIIPLNLLWINAFMILFSHEVLLQMGLQNLVLTNSDRSNFFLANKEGLVSLIGYVSLYLMSVYIGHILNLHDRIVINGPKWKQISIFITLSALTLTFSLVLEKYFGISRKLANSSYCFWVLFIGIFMTYLFYLIEIIQKFILFTNTSFRCICTPFIYEAINYNGLIFFLVANVLTGLVNMACDTLLVNKVVSLSIIICYMIMNCGLICYLFMNKWKLKL